MPRPKGSKNKPGHNAGGKRVSSKPPREPTDVFRLPIWLGKWLKANPRIIEALGSEEFRQRIEEMTGEHDSVS